MICNASISKALIKAVLEQTDELDELGGFAGDKEQAQYVRDVRDVTRKLRAAERVIEECHLQSTYVNRLRGTPSIDGSRG